MPGPPPDPNALRRDRSSDRAFLTLSAPTRRAPSFPLLDPTEREKALWGPLWRLPQASEWHRSHLEVEVGLYVRRLAAAELPEATVALGTLVRQMQDSLGLSLAGMARNRWRIASQAPQPSPSPSASAPRTSSRSRLTVVPPAS